MCIEIATSGSYSRFPDPRCESQYLIVMKAVVILSGSLPFMAWELQEDIVKFYDGRMRDATSRADIVPVPGQDLFTARPPSMGKEVKSSITTAG